MSELQPDLRLQRLLGGAELTSVRTRLRRHFERVEAGSAATTIRLTDLTPDTFNALCQLTGRSGRPARSLTLDIAALDEQLRLAGLANSLRDALERLDGPIVSQAKLRREREAEWSSLLAMDNVGPLLRTWLDTPNALTLLKRLGRQPALAAPLLSAADAVLKWLPAKGLTRSQLAASALGDAHALDSGRAVATLVLAAWHRHEHASITRESPAENDETVDTGTPGDNERQRDIWARAGILVNELARPVLFLNLPPAGSTTWQAGEPGYLSLRQLVRQPRIWPVAGRRIFVCENPDVISIAADRLGVGCAPLVCTDGMPAAAQRILLNQLATAGAQLHYHGDYDWPGINIGNHVIRTWQATPWRFGTQDYLASITLAPQRARDLETKGVEALWDSELASAMREQGLAIAEEAVVETLLEDLA